MTDEVQEIDPFINDGKPVQELTDEEMKQILQRYANDSSGPYIERTKFLLEELNRRETTKELKKQTKETRKQTELVEEQTEISSREESITRKRSHNHRIFVKMYIVVGLFIIFGSLWQPLTEIYAKSSWSFTDSYLGQLHLTFLPFLLFFIFGTACGIAVGSWISLEK